VCSDTLVFAPRGENEFRCNNDTKSACGRIESGARDYINLDGTPD